MPWALRDRSFGSTATGIGATGIAVGTCGIGTCTAGTADGAGATWSAPCALSACCCTNVA